MVTMNLSYLVTTLMKRIDTIQLTLERENAQLSQDENGRDMVIPDMRNTTNPDQERTLAVVVQKAQGSDFCAHIKITPRYLAKEHSAFQCVVSIHPRAFSS